MRFVWRWQVMRVFERPHHQRIAQLLMAVDGDLLHKNQCFFGGGTAIALCCGEYRESLDVGFLVSDIAGYRNLRELVSGEGGISALLRRGMPPLEIARDLRADQYGIRTAVKIGAVPIKFEIVLEGRVSLDSHNAGRVLCGVPVLTPLDMAATKLLANSDRWADAGVFSRDLIDLAMLDLTLKQLRQAKAKAEQAYGAAIGADLQKAINRFGLRPEWMDRCIEVLAISVPKAVLWERIRRLSKL